MAFEPETSEPGPEGCPTVETVRADMGEVRRQFWLAAALKHLGTASDLKDAEDALQQFMMTNVPAVCSGYSPAKGSFDSYLWDSFKYHCWRHAKRERARLTGHVPIETSHADGSVDIRIADERSLTPLELAEVREQKQILANALRELTSIQRKSWIAAEMDGLSYQDAASRLGVPETTFTVELFRARQRIQELIQHYPHSFLAVGEIRDWAGLCRSLRQDGEDRSQSIGKRVWQLSTDELRTVASDPSENVSPQAKARLVHELNEILGRPDFYSSRDVGRIPQGPFTSEIRSLLRRKGGPLTTRRLNKLLFRHHYDRFFLGDI